MYVVEKLCHCGNKITGRTSYDVRNKTYCSVKCFRENYRHSDLIKQKIGDNCRGKPRHSKEWKEALRKKMIGNKHALGHRLSKEHKQAMLRKGKEHWNYKDGRCEDPEYIVWQKRQNQHLKRNAEGSFTKEEWVELKKKHENKCVRCGGSDKESKLSIDHIIPLSKKGTNYISNIQPLCLPCNMRKHAKLPSESW